MIEGFVSSICHLAYQVPVVRRQRAQIGSPLHALQGGDPVILSSCSLKKTIGGDQQWIHQLPLIAPLASQLKPTAGFGAPGASGTFWGLDAIPLAPSPSDYG